MLTLFSVSNDFEQSELGSRDWKTSTNKPSSSRSVVALDMALDVANGERLKSSSCHGGLIQKLKKPDKMKRRSTSATSSKSKPVISNTTRPSPAAFATDSWDCKYSTEEASTKTLERKMKSTSSLVSGTHECTSTVRQTSYDDFGTTSWHGCPDAPTKKFNFPMKQTRRSSNTRSNHHERKTLESSSDAITDAAWSGPAEASTQNSEMQKSSSTRSNQEEPPLDISQAVQKQMKRSSSTRSHHARTLDISDDGFVDATWGGSTPLESSSKRSGSFKNASRRSIATGASTPSPPEVTEDGRPESYRHGRPEPPSTKPGASKNTTRRSSTTSVKGRPGRTDERPSLAVSKRPRSRSFDEDLLLSKDISESSWHGRPGAPSTKPNTSKNATRRSSTSSVKGRLGRTDERPSSAVLSERPRSRSFDEELLSSKDLSAAFAPHKTVLPDVPLIVAATKVETSKVSLDDSFSPAGTTTDWIAGGKYSTKSRSSSTERRGSRGRSSSTSKGRKKRSSDIEEKPDEEVRSKEDRPQKLRARSSSRGGRRRDSASDLGTEDPSYGETATEVRPGRTDERSSSAVLSERPRSRSFDEELLSSKDLSAAFAPHKTVLPDAPLIVAATKVETSKVSLDDSFSPAGTTTDWIAGGKYSTKSRSSSTERRGSRGRSSSTSKGRKKRSSDIEEKPDEEVRSKEDRPQKLRARSSSRGGRRRDSASDLGTEDPSSGETTTAQERRSSCRGRRIRASSRDPGKKQNPARARSSSRGRRKASHDPIDLTDPTQTDPTQTDPTQTEPTQTDPTQTDPTQTSRLRSTSLNAIRRNASINKPSAPSATRSFSGGPSQSSRRRGSSLDAVRRNTANKLLSKSLSGQSLQSGGSKHMSSSVSLRSQLEAKSWDSLQKSFNTTLEDASENACSGGSRNGRASRRMPKGMADQQDKSMDSSFHTATKGLSETKANASCGFLSVDLRGRFRSDFPGAKDMPTDDELKERYRNIQFTASQTAPSQPAPTETTDSKDEVEKEAFGTITTKPKQETYSDRLMAATQGKPSSFTMKSRTRRKSQALSENTVDPFKSKPQESEGAHTMPKLGAPRRGPVLKTFVKSVSMKFSLKNSTINNDTTTGNDGSVKSSDTKSKKKEEKKEFRKTMNKIGKKDETQPEGDDSPFPSITSVTTPKGAKPRGGPAGALFKMTSILKFDKDADWGTKRAKKEPIIVNQEQAKEVETSADSNGNKDKHDYSQTCSEDSRPRSGRDKEGETEPKKDTKKQPDMLGYRTTTGADYTRATKTSKKSNETLMRSSSMSSCTDEAINTNDDVSRSQPASCRKIKFISRSSIANDETPDNARHSCDDVKSSLLASARYRRTSTKRSSSAR